MSILYPKIDTLFNRDKNTFKVTNEIRKLEYLLINDWHITEKVDGTNIRIVVNKNGCTIGGRTDKAQIYPKLQTAVEQLYPNVEEWYFKHFEGEEGVECTLFGEGYGAKVQSGGGYRSDQGFRLFDVWVGTDQGEGKFLDWHSVEEVSDETGIATVPVLSTRGWDFGSISHLVTTIFKESKVAQEDGGSGVTPEGVVARTDPYLYDWKGHRVMWKLKRKDFA